MLWTIWDRMIHILFILWKVTLGGISSAFPVRRPSVPRPHNPRRQSFCSALNIFRARRLIFRIAACLSFLDVHWKFQVSVIFGFGDMTLFFRSCHDPNGQFSTSCVCHGPCELLTPWFRPFLPVLPPTYHGTCCSTMYRGQGQGQGQPRSSKIIAF